MKIPWLPLHVADYLADTSHLSTEQHGAYILLLLHSWQTGPLHNDEKELAQIARMTPDQWRENRETLLRFWHKDCGDKWRNTRLEHERFRIIETSKRRSEAGSKGGTVSAIRRWHPKNPKK